MDLFSVIAVSILLLLAAATMMVLHARTWRAFCLAELDAEEFDYRRRQYRRRMQTSAMLGVLAIAMLVGYPVTAWLLSDWFTVVFWAAVMVMACWVALLAVVDIIATRHHFGRLRHQYLIEQAKLQAEIRRIQSVQGNGKAHGHQHGERKKLD